MLRRDSEPSYRDPLAALRWYWRRVLDLNAQLQNALSPGYRNSAAFTGRLLEGAYSFCTAPATAVIISLVLVPLVISGVIRLITWITVVGAWLIAVLSIPKIGNVKKLSIGRRSAVVLASALFLGTVGYYYIRWSLLHYYANTHPTEAAKAEIPTLDSALYSRFREMLSDELSKYKPGRVVAGPVVVQQPKETDPKLNADLVPVVTFHQYLQPFTNAPTMNVKSYGLLFLLHLYNPSTVPLRIEALEMSGYARMDCQTWMGMTIKGGENIYEKLNECGRRKPFVAVDWVVAPTEQVSFAPREERFIKLPFIKPTGFGGDAFYLGNDQASQYFGYEDDGSKPVLRIGRNMLLMMRPESALPRSQAPEVSDSVTFIAWRFQESWLNERVKIYIRHNAGLTQIKPSHMATPRMLGQKVTENTAAEELFDRPDMFEQLSE